MVMGVVPGLVKEDVPFQKSEANRSNPFSEYLEDLGQFSEVLFFLTPHQHVERVRGQLHVLNRIGDLDMGGSKRTESYGGGGGIRPESCPWKAWTFDPKL